MSIKKVKDKLTGRKVSVFGINEKGQPRTMYMTDEVPHLIHINLAGKELYVEGNELLDGIGKVLYGEEYVERLNNARHVKKECDDECQ